MSIDLTPEELARLLQLLDAGNMADPVNATIHVKIMQSLQNFKRPELELQEPRDAAEKWRGPI